MGFEKSMKAKPAKVEQEVARPFRLWNPYEGVYLRWRCYGSNEKAHIGAFVQIRWAKVGHTIEVIDVRTMRFTGSYTLNVKSIDIRKPKR